MPLIKILTKLILICLILLFNSLSIASTKAEYIKLNAQPFLKGALPNSFLKSFEEKKLILIGEQHGTNEMPELAFNFISSFAKKYEIAVGVEFPINLQKEVDSFLKTGNEQVFKDLKFFKDANYHSGRGSLAMVSFLKKIRKIENIKVFCFEIDENQSDSNPTDANRDSQMAQNILMFSNSNPQRVIITYSGNIHSRLVMGTPWDPQFKNMGSEVLRLSKGKFDLQNSLNFQFRADFGEAWQCQSNIKKEIVCKNYKFGPVNSVYSTSVPFEHFTLKESEITDGHFYSVFIKSLSASAPWTEGK